MIEKYPITTVFIIAMMMCGGLCYSWWMVAQNHTVAISKADYDLILLIGEASPELKPSLREIIADGRISGKERNELDTMVDGLVATNLKIELQ